MPVPPRILRAIETRAARLTRLEDAVVASVLDLLSDLQDELVAELTRADPTGPQRITWRRARLKKLLEQTERQINEAYRELQKRSQAHLEVTARAELQFTTAQIRELLDPIRSFVSVNTVAISPEILRQLATNTVVHMGESLGALPMRDWLADQARETQVRFAQQMHRAILSGESTAQMVRRVVGARGRPGIMDVSRHLAEALVRTSTQAVMGEARRTVYAKNRHAVKGIQQITTEDDRTTLICIAYAGKRWQFLGDGSLEPVGHSLPYRGGIPRHPNCRSGEVPWVKSLEEMGITEADEVPPAIRRVLDGQGLPGKDGEALLARIGPKRAREILGKGRWELWEAGKLPLEDLVGPTGGVQTLEQLRGG
jgi:hypothetical protein